MFPSRVLSRFTHISRLGKSFAVTFVVVCVFFKDLSEVFYAVLVLKFFGPRKICAHVKLKKKKKENEKHYSGRDLQKILPLFMYTFCT